MRSPRVDLYIPLRNGLCTSLDRVVAHVYGAGERAGRKVADGIGVRAEKKRAVQANLIVRGLLARLTGQPPLACRAHPFGPALECLYNLPRCPHRENGRRRNGNGMALVMDRGLLNAREILVRSRVQLINHVRGVVKTVGARVPSSGAAQFAKKAGPALPETMRSALDPILHTIQLLTDQIVDFERKIQAVAKERYPETEL